VTQFSYNSKKIEFYDESQARDSSGKWTGSGGEGKESLSGTTTVYHGTTADVLGKIREAGLKPSRDGVHGKGVYATDNQRLALEYGCLKAPQATKIGGKVLLGIVEVVASGFKSVYEEKRDKDPYKVFLSEKEVLPSAIKKMMIFDAKPVRKWIFEGGEKPKPIAVKNLEEGTIFVPILIDESELTNLEEGECPLATQDIKLNLANRKKAIDTASYGPANPKEPNEDYWIARSKTFNNTPEEAKTMRCGNCAAFNKTSRMLACIKGGIGEDSEEVAKAGDLGFCEIFDFKCASLRTCDAWVVGGPIQDKDVKNFYDPSQQRDESGKWAGSGASAEGKFIERIKSQNPNADVASEAVKKGVNTIIKGVRGAKIAGQYGATKTAEIKKWLGSSEGKEFLNTAGDTLRTIGAGAIGAIRGVHNDRYKILVGALINPALVPYLAGQAATRGMFNGIIEEYRGQGRGREISNKIREKIGVKPMQAFVHTIQMQVKQPPLEDVASYLADVLRVSIEEAIEGKERFEVVSFYDPSQDRDSSGKWTGGGGGGGAKEPEQGMPIYDEDENKPISPIGDSDEELTQAEKIEKELNPSEQEYAQEFMQVIGPPKREKNLEANSEEYKKDVVGWSKAFSEQKVDKEEAVQMAQSLHEYAGGRHRDINQSVRDMDTAKSPDLDNLAIADAIVSAMEVAPKIKESVIWRGTKSGTDRPLGESYTHKLAKNAKVGQILEDNALLSCSFNESVGKDFANWAVGNKGVQSKVLMKVKNANGVGVKMPSFASSFINEKEVLLPPETKLKITSVKRTKEPVNALFRGEDTHVYHTQIEAEIVK